MKYKKFPRTATFDKIFKSIIHGSMGGGGGEVPRRTATHRNSIIIIITKLSRPYSIQGGDENCIQNFDWKKPEGKRPLGKPSCGWKY
jgi:hypothetical protein